MLSHITNKRIYICVIIALAYLLSLTRAADALLTITSDTINISYGTVTKADLNNGFIEVTTSDLTYAFRLKLFDDVPSRWTLMTRAETPVFISSTGDKSCSDVMWRLNGDSIYSSYTTNDVTVLTGDGDTYVDFDIKVLVGWTDTPDLYNINVTFTLFEYL